MVALNLCMPKSVRFSIAATVSIISAGTAIYAFKVWRLKRNSRLARKGENSYESLIGETPLIKLEKLSALIGDGKTLYVKMESMNPGGTGKDRAALFMLRNAEEKGLLPPAASKSKCTHNTTEVCFGPKYNSCIKDDFVDHTKYDTIESTIKIAVQRTKTGGIIVEGTSGSTGISLATLAVQRGHSTIIVMPDDQSKEKQTILRCLGAVLHVVPPAAISNPNHYVNVARMIAEKINRLYGTQQEKGKIKAAFMNQFENEANFMAHFHTTGPEIWRQMNYKVDAFCMSSGTGGTISGVGHYLKSKCQYAKECCKIILIDPPGSSLFNKVKYNIAFAAEQKERSLRRHRYDTIAEGIGLDRITRNFALGSDNGIFDDAIRVSDQEAVDMAHWLLKEEGLFVGSSSAMNVYGAAIYAKSSMSPGTSIITVICDGGQRHLTRFWNHDFIKARGLQWPSDDCIAWRERLSNIWPQQES